MDKIAKLLNEICERCENYAVDTNCEDINVCPAYKLYNLAKTKNTRKHTDSWGDTTPRNSECLGVSTDTGYR